MVIAFDDRYAIAGTADGTVMVFEIKQDTESKSVLNIPPEFGLFEDIIIPRRHVIEKNLKISDLEHTIHNRMDESQYQQRKGDSSQAEKLQQIHIEHCAALEEHKQSNSRMKEANKKRVDELLSIIEENKHDHVKQLQNLESEYNDKMAAQHEKRQEIQSSILTMKSSYEDKLTNAKELLQNSVERMEIKFKNQLQERQDLLRDLMQELEDKKSQFHLYCQTTNLDYEKKIIELKTTYELRIMNLSKQLEEYQLENVILRKQLSNSRVNCDELETDKLQLLQEHTKNQRGIQDLKIRCAELRDEVRDRDHVIHEKETHLNSCDKRIQELERYKNVLNYKIEELNAADEPRNQELGEQIEKIRMLEENLEDVVKYGMKLETRLSVLNDKLNAFKIDLESERKKRRATEAILKRIYRDIYIVSRQTLPKELKQGVTELYHK